MKTGRPVHKRTAKTLARDIAALRRVRKAITMDSTLDSGKVLQAVEAIDTAVTALRQLYPSMQAA